MLILPIAPVAKSKGPTAEMKSKPTPELAKELLTPSQTSSQKRQQAAEALALRGAEGAKSAIAAMHDARPEVRSAGCEVIRLMPECGFDGRGCGTARAEVGHARIALDSLSELLLDSDPDVRDHASQAIAAIGASSKKAEEVLFQRMQDNDPVVAAHSAEALEATRAIAGMDRAQVFPVVLKLLKHPRGEARVAAVHMLNQMHMSQKGNADDSISVRALLDLVRLHAEGHWGERPRVEAASVLARWHVPEAVTACKLLLNEERQEDHEFVLSSTTILKTLESLVGDAKDASPDIERFIAKTKAGKLDGKTKSSLLAVAAKGAGHY